MRTTAPRGAVAAAPGSQVLPGEFVLRDGTPALIWPLLPTDGEALREGFRRLSGYSRRRLFLGVLSQLDDSMIRRLAGSVDGAHHIALVLIVLPPDGDEGPVGSPVSCSTPMIWPPPASPSPSPTTGKVTASAPHWSRRFWSGARRRSPGCARSSTPATASRWRCSPAPGACHRTPIPPASWTSRSSSPRPSASGRQRQLAGEGNFPCASRPRPSAPGSGTGRNPLATTRHQTGGPCHIVKAHGPKARPAGRVSPG